MRHLVTNVHVDGVWYRPGEVPPADVAERIGNPKAWSEEAETQESAKAPESASVKQPPRKGPGSGGPAWIEFAKSKGVTAEFDSKDALIADLEDRGLIEKE
jgi:hypothetical protein